MCGIVASFAAHAGGASNIEQAVELVATNVMPVYGSSACRRFMAEGEIHADFDIVIRERRNATCGGDPAVSPVVDRFRVPRDSDVILWMDPASGEYVPYGRFLHRRR